MMKPPEKSLGVVIRSAQWLGNGTKPSLTTRCFNTVHQWTVADEVLRSAEVMQSEAVAYVAPDPDKLSEPCVPVLAADPPPIDTVETLHTAPMLPEPEAAAVPSPPPPEPEAKADDQQLAIVFGERRYRVRGWPKQLGEALKVNVLVTRATDEAFAAADAAEAGLHVDTFDLYQAKQRQAFAKLASIELRVDESVIQHDLGRLLLKLEQVIDERARAAEKPDIAPPAAMTPQETAALAFLRDAKLAERIASDFERVGLVGDPSNALVAYLACISRKLASPFAVLIQSTSAAGKSTLMDSVLALVPKEDRVHYSAMTGQSLFYLGEREIKHKILAIAEEEGVRQAAYAVRAHDREHRQGSGDRDAGHAAVPGRRAGDAVPDDDRDRCGRGTGEPVSRAHDQ